MWNNDNPNLQENIITGRTFGEIVAVQATLRPKEKERTTYPKNSWWECECKCGKTLVRPLQLVKRGYSCGCDSKKTTYKTKIGKQVGRFFVVGKTEPNRHVSWELAHTTWLHVICKCGNNIAIPSSRLNELSKNKCSCQDSNSMSRFKVS